MKVEVLGEVKVEWVKVILNDTRIKAKDGGHVGMKMHSNVSALVGSLLVGGDGLNAKIGVAINGTAGACRGSARGRGRCNIDDVIDFCINLQTSVSLCRVGKA